MEAQTLNCPNCGAAISSDSPQCQYCESKLATVACPSCFGMMFIGSRYCPHCAAAPAHQLGSSPEPDKIRYVPCPQCGQLMNRINFAHCSGVIVDVCKGHGTWFDRDELREIVEFIRGGGLEVCRQKEKMEIEFERQQLHRDRLVAASLADAHGFSYRDEDRIGGLSAARGLLKFLLE